MKLRPARETEILNPLTWTPFPFGEEIPAYTPAGALIETDLLMASAPYPAESSTTISPPSLVTSCAAWSERHGAERLHGLASEPIDATNVRIEVASASIANSDAANQEARREIFTVLWTRSR